MLEIYSLQVPYEMCPQVFSRLLTCVSVDKRKRIRRLKRKQDIYRTLLADLLIRSIILDKYGVSNQEISFKYNKYNKPFFALDCKFSFNVSHSGKWVVAIIGNNQLVGIDIEEIRPIEMEVAKRFFSPEEFFDLSTKGEQEQLMYFYDLWTLKESFVKAIGRGLSIPLDSFIIWRKEEEFSIIQDHSLRSFFFRQYDIDSAYKLSTCATIDRFPESVKFCNISWLCQRMLYE